MKTGIITFLSANIFMLNIAFSQGTAINTSGAAADNSAILDVSSTSQGLLIPRMTETNRVTIASPATGLLVYQTDVVKGFYYYNGTAWTYIGADNLGNHTATDSLNLNNRKIYNLATCTYNYDAANKLYVDSKVSAGGGGGSLLPTVMSDESPATYTFRDAIKFCDTLTQGGFTDWYMPTFHEFWQLMCINPAAVSNPYSGNFVWLKETNPSSQAYFLYITRLSDGYTSGQGGNSTARARCMR